MSACRAFIPAAKNGAFRMAYRPSSDRVNLRGDKAVEQMATSPQFR